MPVPWDRRMEDYLRGHGIDTLLGVVAPLSVVPAGVVHLSDGTQTAEVGKLLAEHPDVVHVGPFGSPTMLPFKVRADAL